jgi:hypothetical protein
VPPYGWSQVHVEGWAKRLRIPPFHDALPVQAKGSGCLDCGPSLFSGARTLTVFPGGAEMICGRCRTQWLELDPTGIHGESRA